MRLTLTIVLFALCLCLASCNDPPEGNGEGYTGIMAVPTDLPGRDLTAVLYYWIEPGYTCLNTLGINVASYRGAIQLGTTTYVQYGDYCHREPTASGMNSDLQIQGDLIGFGTGIYQKERGT